MKQKKLLLGVVMVGALGALLFFHRPSTSPEPISRAIAVPTPRAATAVAATTALPVIAVAKKVPDAFENFSQWAANFTNGMVTLVDGERFAWKRREAMLELIQNDPQRAIELSVPFELRQMLPRD